MNIFPGGNGARNYGFKMSQGEYIQWFDSDDLMLNHNLEFSIKTGIRQKADVVFKKHNPQEEPYSLVSRYDRTTQKSDSFFVDYMIGQYPVVTNDVFVKKSIVNVSFDESLRKAQEFDFFSRLFQQQLVYLFTLEITHIQKESIDSISEKTSLGSYAQFKSLIILSKKMINNYDNQPEIIERGKRQGRKLYKSYLKKGKIKFILLNFNYFAQVYNKSLLIFISFFLYNLLTKKGFDYIKSKSQT